MQVDVKGSPEQVSGLLANLKEAGISVLRSSLSFQTTSQQDGTILNQVTSSLTISPKQ